MTAHQSVQSEEARCFFFLILQATTKHLVLEQLNTAGRRIKNTVAIFSAVISARTA